MAAAAATATTVALSSRGKRESDIAGAGIRPKKKKAAKSGVSPPKEEVEAFLAAAESAVALRFATKYNYDVVKDAPMDGRFEWIRVRP